MRNDPIKKLEKAARELRAAASKVNHRPSRTMMREAATATLLRCKNLRQQRSAYGW